MPELPEVEVLARHLEPLVTGRVVRQVEVRRNRVIRPTTEDALAKALTGAAFDGLSRRGKYLLFTLRPARGGGPVTLLGHLGMTGRIYLAPRKNPLPKHAAVVMDLGADNLVFEDTRYFGRLTLDTHPLARLGPEPLGKEFTEEYLGRALKRSSQAVKVKLLDQSLVAGIGNIYAGEALFQSSIDPVLPAKRLTAVQVQRLWQAMREVLTRAIELGSSLPLALDGVRGGDGLSYFGAAAGGGTEFEERFMVYDREGGPCPKCATPIRRRVQGARSTYYCPRCQGRRRKQNH
jgi:formamidopyrimidine-DNA glycosylase